MKYCPNCGAQLEEGAASCPSCGAFFVAQPSAAPAPVYGDLTDHTAEFDPADISENKVFAMLPYLLSLVGVVIALLARNGSKYTDFHIRQSLKIFICQAFVAMVSAILAITLIVPLAGAICEIILLVVQIICFFQVCAGKAKEPAIVNRFGFLK